MFRRPERRASMSRTFALTTVLVVFSSTLAAEIFGPAATSFPVGGDPRAVAIGDFDDDGVPDLAVVSAGGGTVSILLGDGVGGFSLPSDVPAGDQPAGLAIGDFDGDGDVDLAVTSVTGNSVRVLLGDGKGGFAHASDFPVGKAPGAVAVADFNADGAIDLAIADSGSDAISILVGDGLGGFSQAAAVAVGRFPSALGVGDFNRDGVPDLAVVNRDDVSVSILLGDGRGGFSRVDVAIGGVGDPYVPVSVVVGDFNGDRVDDLAIPDSGSPRMTVLLGDGHGGFSATQLQTAAGCGTVAAADLNGDGIADLVAPSTAGGRLTVLLGDGHGGFVRFINPWVGNHPSAVAAGDFNLDGLQDLAVADGDGIVTVLLGDGHGGFTYAPAAQDSETPLSLAVADVDGDGRLDLVYGIPSGTVVARGDGAGGFAQAQVVFPQALAGRLVAADLNGDGAVDLAGIVPDSPDDGVLVLLQSGGENFFQSDSVFPDEILSSLAVGDFNADGIPDLVGVGRFVMVALGDGSGRFLETPGVFLGCNPADVAVGDFNLDGLLDVAIACVDGTLTILSGDGRGGFQGRSRWSFYGRPVALQSGDFNGDGVVDLALVSRLAPPYSEAILLRGLGDGSYAPEFEAFSSNEPRGAMAADFNSDGALDLAIVDAEAKNVTLLMGDPGDRHGEFSISAAFQVGAAPGALAVGDFDADGNPDLAVANFGGGGVSVVLNQIEARSDVNGSNRIDGFDLDALGRLAGLRSWDAGYRRNADVDLNGVIDGDDLARVARRFGRLNREPSSSGDATPSQRIGATPSSLDFGRVAIGASARRTLRISNLGSSQLTVVRVATPPEFRSPAATSFTVPPFGFVECPVMFTPARNGVFSEEIEIDSDDPNHPAIRVAVRGRSAAGLATVPDRLDFGPVRIGTTAKAHVWVTNRGPAPFTLAGVISTDPAIVADPGFTSLAAGQTGEVTVRFQPTGPKSVHALVAMRFLGSPPQVVVLTADGSGDPDLVSTSDQDRSVVWYENLGAGQCQVPR